MSTAGTGKRETSARAGAIIPAAGFGTRMGADRPKQFLELAGAPVLIRTIRIFLDHPAISAVVVALPPSHYQQSLELFTRYLASPLPAKLILTRGGASRQKSVSHGLAALPPQIDTVLVHDGARPLVSDRVIGRCLTGVASHGAVIAAVPAKDTLKEVDPESGRIITTIDRSRVWLAQTPQAMRRELLEQAFRQAAEDGFTGTDEASLLEHGNIPVYVVAGDEQNIKLTRPGDLTLASSLLGESGKQKNRRADRDQEKTMRIGSGFDAHRLVEGRKLILGGVDIPHPLGLLGHSDADVLIHALMDALLGALGEGDIGRHFPDSDKRFRNISSLKLLEQVMSLLEARQMVLVNADLTIICQQPRLAPFLDQMLNNLQTACHCDAINIKATTTEKMGFTGRREGIAAQAVVLLSHKDT
ncbi:bifunctional enzyme IspD/IspF [Desulfolithobacter dissulfuricans]|uniref:Bifunctional enzyme IspD/IspF n=1 Tax=Desulfolithobacter dissulfuricans TaxID=2795293 RepID=A0A915XJF7_9BACT|nr:2-C-methyl-D-erythritol 4-phosphate cytidylyltransferase [Desulfolithobacter dissulfuricans]BCO10255.1 bifunctional enzyme IspD/IspF [Desulfolithobacter dissulfuricans]